MSRRGARRRMLGGAGMMLLGGAMLTPLLVGLATLGTEAAQGISVFDPALGGDPLTHELTAQGPFYALGAAVLVAGILLLVSGVRRRVGSAPMRRSRD